MRFRKLPVVIDAVPVQSILTTGVPNEDWVQEAIDRSKINLYTECIIVTTLEGRMRGEITDWLIRGVHGELYPIKSEILAATYEAVPE